MRRFQITCYCSRYSFPHRLGGGLCDGSGWAELVNQIKPQEFCVGCNCNGPEGCEVASGQESLLECEAYQQGMHQELNLDSSELIKETVRFYEEDYYDHDCQHDSHDECPF